MTEVYVVDLETTGLGGCPVDHAVDVGLVNVDLTRETVSTVFTTVIGYDTSEWDDLHRNAWIFNHTDLTLDKVDSIKAERPLERVRSTLIEILHGQNLTSYNTSFDLDKFLFRAPWDLSGIVNRYPCLMMSAAAPCKLEGRTFWTHADETTPSMGKYHPPKLSYAYETLCPDDPAHIKGKQTHRALSDAHVAGHLLLAMHKTGFYPDMAVSP